MTERIDAGPVLAQCPIGRIPEVVSPADTWNLVRTGLPGLLERAISMVLAGESQVEEQATYAGFSPPEWDEITWAQSRAGAHHQVRAFRFLHGGAGPVVEMGGRRIRILRTSTREQPGPAVDCTDGPLWITEYESA